MSDDAHPLAAGVLAALKNDAPDFIRAWPALDSWLTGEWSRASYLDEDRECILYVRHDPAVLADLPEVKAMIAAAVMEAAQIWEAAQ